MRTISFHSPAALANELSSQEFELLIRFYLKKQLVRLASRENSLTLNIQTEYGSDPADLKKVEWQLGSWGETVTKGELLEAVVGEHNRRRGFEEGCKLLLIEAPAEQAAAPMESDIPF